MKSFKDTEIGREFLAGKCYLRVRKEEYTKFVKMCDDDKLSWYAARGEYVHNLELGHDAFRLSGSGIASAPTQSRAVPELPVHPFSDLCAEPEKPAQPAAPYDGRGKHKVGDRFEVVSNRKNFHHFTDGDEIELAGFSDNGNHWYRRLRDGMGQFVPPEDLEPYASPKPVLKIIITTDGRVTTARLMEGKQTIKTATATCSPDDTFDFDKGARLAFARLFPGVVRELSVQVHVDTSAAKASIQSVIDALNDLPNRVKVVRK